MALRSLADACHRRMLGVHLREDPYITLDEHLQLVAVKYMSRGEGIHVETLEDAVMEGASREYWEMNGQRAARMDGCSCGRGCVDPSRYAPWKKRCREMRSPY